MGTPTGMRFSLGSRDKTQGLQQLDPYLSPIAA